MTGMPFVWCTVIGVSGWFASTMTRRGPIRLVNTRTAKGGRVTCDGARVALSGVGVICHKSGSLITAILWDPDAPTHGAYVRVLARSVTLYLRGCALNSSCEITCGFRKPLTPRLVCLPVAAQRPWIISWNVSEPSRCCNRTYTCGHHHHLSDGVYMRVDRPNSPARICPLDGRHTQHDTPGVAPPCAHVAYAWYTRSGARYATRLRAARLFRRLAGAPLCTGMGVWDGVDSNATDNYLSGLTRRFTAPRGKKKPSKPPVTSR
jgi:hypothetical protein